METIALLIENEKERTVLEHYFQGLNYTVLALKSNFSTYRTIIDTRPLCVICELPSGFLDHVYIIRLLSNQKKTENIPVIAYGNHNATAIIRSFYESGVELYYQRPLQIKLLLEDIEDIKNGTSIKIKRYRTTPEQAPVKASAQHCQASPQSSRHKSQEPSVKVAALKQTENILTVPAEELEAVERLMNPGTTPDERVEIIIGRVTEMLAFPFTIVKILEITQNDESGAADLAKAISADPVIVSSLLSISNTVYYARQAKRINDVQEAIVRLGFVETKNIALSLSVMSMFSSDAKSAGFNRFEFWYHSLACGILSEMFAKKINYPHPEKAFICGLLHDFGIILLDEFFNAFFTSIYGQVAKNKTEFIAEEKRLWGMSHNSAVSQLFRNWNVPSDITYAMGQLDLFGSRQCIDPQNDDLILVNIVGLSNLLAKSLQLGRDCDEIIYPVNRKILDVLKCPEGIEEEFIGTCIERLTVYSEFFNLEKRTFSYPPEKKPDMRSISVIDHTKEMFFPHKYILGTLGYAIDEPSTADKRQILEKRPEAILNLINSSIPEKYLEPFVNFPKESSPLHGKIEQFIPAIFISMDKKPDLNFKALSKAYCIPAAVHMGLLASIIENLIAQQAVKGYEELAAAGDSQADTVKTVTVNYLNDQTALLSLHGVIRLNSFNEIRFNLAKLLEQKRPYLAVHLGDIVDIDNLMTNLLVNFQKKTAESGLTLCFCCIGKKIPDVLCNSEALKAVQQFKHKDDLIAFLNRSQAQLTAI